MTSEKPPRIKPIKTPDLKPDEARGALRTPKAYRDRLRARFAAEEAKERAKPK